jgi:predicted enzyme related to lactoylglutathione lyase
MENPIAHFAINSDDVPATRRFYETVFGWTFTAWGPPEFYRITAGSGLPGALQRRRNLIPDTPTVGFEATIAVQDVDAVAAAVTAHGGRILMEKTVIAGVGELIFFADPGGSVAGAMRYDPDAG